MLRSSSLSSGIIESAPLEQSLSKDKKFTSSTRHVHNYAGTDGGSWWWPRQKGGQLIERCLLFQRNVCQLTLDNWQTVPSAEEIVGEWLGEMLRIKFDRLEKWQLGWRYDYHTEGQLIKGSASGIKGPTSSPKMIAKYSPRGRRIANSKGKVYHCFWHTRDKLL